MFNRVRKYWTMSVTCIILTCVMANEVYDHISHNTAGSGRNEIMEEYVRRKGRDSSRA